VTIRHRKTDRYAAGNLEAARIITASPEKYPPGSLVAIWAALVLERAGDGAAIAGPGRRSSKKRPAETRRK
jgi:hypothetical protein